MQWTKQPKCCHRKPPERNPRKNTEQRSTISACRACLHLPDHRADLPSAHKCWALTQNIKAPNASWKQWICALPGCKHTVHHHANSKAVRSSSVAALPEESTPFGALGISQARPGKSTLNFCTSSSRSQKLPFSSNTDEAALNKRENLAKETFWKGAKGKGALWVVQV